MKYEILSFFFKYIFLTLNPTYCYAKHLKNFLMKKNLSFVIIDKNKIFKKKNGKKTCFFYNT